MGVDDLTIVCPSMGRAKACRTTLDWFPEVILCVPEREVEEYRRYSPDAEIDPHPDDLFGLPRKRNWIAERYGDFFSVDDDNRRLQNLSIVLSENSTVDPKLTIPIIKRTYEMAEDVGAYLFGFSSRPNPLMYRGQVPFQLTGYLGGHAFGLRKGHDLYWHPECYAHTDFWICGLNAFKHRKVFVDHRYRFDQAETFTRTGGQAAHRTVDREMASLELLQRTFGKDVIHRKRGTHRAKQRHEGQPALKLPF